MTTNFKMSLLIPGDVTCQEHTHLATFGGLLDFYATSR